MISRLLIGLALSLSLFGCSDAEREQQLVDLFETADQDLISIEFPANAQNVVSAGSSVDFSIVGTKSNGTDTVSLSGAAQWSLSAGAASSIDQSGRLTAASTAETVTITARVGVLETSFDVRVSTAKFDKIVQLDSATADLDMCRARTLYPEGRYVPDQGEDEIRPVDNLILESITWEVLNAEDSSASQRAYIDSSGVQPRLHALAAGDLVIRATAPSVYQGVNVTSSDLTQTISNSLNSIKLCLANASDLDSCQLSSPSVEQNLSTELIAVGNFQDSASTSSNENISRWVKWGTSTPDAAELLLAADYSSLQITGLQENTSTTVSAACGSIEQSLSEIEVSEGVVLASSVSCGSNANCVAASATVDIDPLSVDSYDVTVNGDAVSNDTSLQLSSAPEELTVKVTADFADGVTRDITEDSDLEYSIISLSGQDDVIEKKSGSTGVFNVIGSGTAKIQLNYRTEKVFIILVEVP